MLSYLLLLQLLLHLLHLLLLHPQLLMCLLGTCGYGWRGYRSPPLSRRRRRIVALARHPPLWVADTARPH